MQRANESPDPAWWTRPGKSENGRRYKILRLDVEKTQLCFRVVRTTWTKSRHRNAHDLAPQCNEALTNLPRTSNTSDARPPRNEEPPSVNDSASPASNPSTSAQSLPDSGCTLGRPSSSVARLRSAYIESDTPQRQLLWQNKLIELILALGLQPLLDRFGVSRPAYDHNCS